jgi:hypothetical protein
MIWRHKKENQKDYSRVPNMASPSQTTPARDTDGLDVLSAV